jgi:hypothetical protein
MSSARTSASKSRARPASRSPSLLPVPSPVELSQTGENDPPVLMFRELDADQVDALPSANSAEVYLCIRLKRDIRRVLFYDICVLLSVVD